MNNPESTTPLTCSGSWIPVDDSDPESVPQRPGHYLVACEGGNVTESFYVTDLKWYDNKRQQGRKRNGKYSRRFEISQYGYKITHWMPLPLPPNDRNRSELSGPTAL
jgi:hypothetical protein